jgi:hypothetical protein
MERVMPMRMASGLEREERLAWKMASEVVPWRLAILERVSPDWTV